MAGDLTDARGTALTLYDDVNAIDRLVSRRHRPWRLAAVAAAVLIVLGWVMVAAASLGRDPAAVRSPLIGKPAPTFDLTTLDGDRVESSSFDGDVLVVNFWATWCVPCRQEAPELEAFARRNEARGVQLVGVVYSDSRDQAVAFRDEFRLSFPQAMDSNGRTAIDFGVFGVPETYVIARNGLVMAKLIGAVDAATLETVVAEVEQGRSVTTENDRYRTEPGS